MAKTRKNIHTNVYNYHPLKTMFNMYFLKSLNTVHMQYTMHVTLKVSVDRKCSWI